jgi:plasmid maintenance system antidote protein VapI
MKKTKIGYPEQLMYKEIINEKGLKIGFVCSKINVAQSTFSQYINGRIPISGSVEKRLREFLNLDY